MELNDGAGDAREHGTRERNAVRGRVVGTGEDVREARADTRADN